MIHGVHHVAVSTANLDRLLDFYVNVIGFTPADEEMRWRGDSKIDAVIGLKGSAARTRLLRAGNCYIELFQYADPPPREAQPLRPCDRGYTHLALEVTDIQAEFRRLTAAGMKFVDDHLGDFGDIVTLYGHDPDGNIIELQQLSPKLPISIVKLGTVKFPD